VKLKSGYEAVKKEPVVLEVVHHFGDAQGCHTDDKTFD